jgi:hypothetical protein
VPIQVGELRNHVVIVDVAAEGQREQSLVDGQGLVAAGHVLLLLIGWIICRPKIAPNIDGKHSIAKYFMTSRRSDVLYLNSRVWFDLIPRSIAAAILGSAAVW